jgi:DNA-binding MarR family transcriptional regulator
MPVRLPGVFCAKLMAPGYRRWVMAERPKAHVINDQIDLLVSLLRLAALISRPMRDGVADPAGFSSDELRILMALSGEGASAGHDLAELMGMHAMNVSRALASLHRMGLVERVRDTRNRRRKPYRVSPRGAAAQLALGPAIVRVARFLLGVLTESERRQLRMIIAKLDHQILTWHPRQRHPHVPRA